MALEVYIFHHKKALLTAYLFITKIPNSSSLSKKPGFHSSEFVDTTSTHPNSGALTQAILDSSLPFNHQVQSINTS